MSSPIAPLFAFVITLGIFFAYVGPTWSGSVAATKAAITLDDQALVAASEYTTQQNALAAARSGIDPSDLDRLAAFLPDSVDNVGLILDLNALAARSGLVLANIDVVSNDSGGQSTGGTQSILANSGNPIGSVDISLAAVGTFSALETFLKGVERSARLLDVQNVVVKGSDTGVYNYQMALRLYWLR